MIENKEAKQEEQPPPSGMKNFLLFYLYTLFDLNRLS